jgi:hypothetical protein
MKALIFDASTLITFSMNGMLNELKKLRKGFDGKFLITKDVLRETVDKPSKIPRFKLEALRVKRLVTDKTLEMPNSVGVSSDLIVKKTEEFKEIANSTFESTKKMIHLIDSGEASCLALSRILDEKGVENVIAVDERTTRVIGEKPENLKKIMEGKLHTQLTSKKENYKFFKGFKFIRSAELVYVMYKKGIIDVKDGELDALLYAMKYKGCAISRDEIEEIKKMK